MGILTTFHYAKKYYVSDTIEYVDYPNPITGITPREPDDLLKLLANTLKAEFVDTQDLLAGIATIRIRLDVGIGGTILTAYSDGVGIAETNPKQELDVGGDVYVDGSVGIGSVYPQQRLDVAGSVKIDEFIYDSVNARGRNGYFMGMDVGGIRWLPQDADSEALIGVYIQDEGTFIGTTP